MSNTTPRLGLKTYDTSDPFLRQDFNDQSAKLDAYPGAFICTSASRPAWGPSQAGMRIYETDTRRELVWTGTAWRAKLDAPPVWTGYVQPVAAMGKDTHVYYKLGTFQVNRPGALLVHLEVEFSCQSIYTANVAARAQVDGSDSHIGSTASYMRVGQTNTSGAGWSRHFMMGAVGLRAVGVGSHNFGIHFYTSPTATTSAVSVSLESVRGYAMLVNSQDT
ncbi:hypothetical protein ACH4S8_37695 [Streptomyces sp. NPDC021080]|uniref:hypothetical protein n=1 Tax=Streptomyces sp. NPDC021080 TaxID=3365110 RepID=UPI00379EB5DA